MLGTYVFNAFSIVSHNLNRKPGTRALDWMDEPIALVSPTKDDLEARAKVERERAIAFFNSLVNSRGAKEGTADGGA